MDSSLSPGTVLCSNLPTHMFYGCDGVDDFGWGCGIRVIQMILDGFDRVDSSCDRCLRLEFAEIVQILCELEGSTHTSESFREWISLDHIILCIATIFRTSKQVEIRAYPFTVQCWSDAIERLPLFLLNHFRNHKSVVAACGGGLHICIGGVRVHDSSSYDLFVLDPHGTIAEGPTSPSNSFGRNRIGDGGVGWISWYAFFFECLDAEVWDLPVDVCQDEDDTSTKVNKTQEDIILSALDWTFISFQM